MTDLQNFELGLGSVLDLESIISVARLTVVQLVCHPDDLRP